MHIGDLLCPGAVRKNPQEPLEQILGIEVVLLVERTIGILVIQFLEFIRALKYREKLLV
jgi:hypothetical protein